MAHFAKIVDGVVVQVMVCEPEFFNDFVDSSPGQWIQTSYNTRGGIHYVNNTETPSEDKSKSLRKNYATVGGTYDAKLDGFIPPKPYPSWILNEDTCLWEPPIPKPENGIHEWDEDNQVWISVS